MEAHKNLVRADRLEIGILLRKGYSLRAIARELERSPNTIAYEVKKNSVNGRYQPLKADAKARLRKRQRRFQWSKIEHDPALKKLVIEKLKEHWNPDEIAGWLKRTKAASYVSKSAIYQWLRTARGERYCTHLYSKRTRVCRWRRKTMRTLIPNRVDISKRFRGATNRTRYRHCEADTVVGKKGTPGGVKTAYERKARLFMAKKVASMRPKEHAEVERAMFKGVAALSVTRDNGIENRDHEQVPIPSFFAPPYHSWEKGGVENGNKMLRRYFPKRTDFSAVSQAELDRACAIINNKPRKILGYRSALTVALRAGIIKNSSVLIQG